MIDLPPEYLLEVRRILAEVVPECEVRAFGSRVSGRAQTYSDLDLAIVGRGSIDAARLEALKDAFSDSGLPFIVDVLDWNAISESFRKVISGRYEVLQEAGQSKTPLPGGKR